MVSIAFVFVPIADSGNSADFLRNVRRVTAQESGPWLRTGREGTMVVEPHSVVNSKNEGEVFHSALARALQATFAVGVRHDVVLVIGHLPSLQKGLGLEVPVHYASYARGKASRQLIFDPCLRFLTNLSEEGWSKALEWVWLKSDTLPYIVANKAVAALDTNRSFQQMRSAVSAAAMAVGKFARLENEHPGVEFSRKLVTDLERLLSASNWPDPPEVNSIRRQLEEFALQVQQPQSNFLAI
jgi:hypothetical protein